MQLEDSVKTVKGVGDKMMTLLEKLNIFTVRDLIRHYPTDYDNFEMPVQINSVSEGQIVTVEGAVSRVTTRPTARKKVITCYVSDPSGALKLVWFNQQYLLKLLKPGYRFLFRGTVKETMRNMPLPSLRCTSARSMQSSWDVSSLNTV